MKKKILTYTFLFIFLIGNAGTQRDKGPDPAVVQRGIEIKVEQFRKRKLKECKERALERAIVIADSLMTTRAIKIKNDTIDRPPRALKPIKPEFTPIPDTIPVKPILKKNQKVDIDI